MKTKTAFTIFLFLTIFIFPYYIIILCINSSFLSSIIPAKLIPTFIKFFILVVVSFYYWKLSKITEEISFKKLILHLTLTLPAILIAKMNVYQFVTVYFYNSESILSQIQMVVLINVLVNILFFTGQILFAIDYNKTKKQNYLNITE
jgi:uncharacterized membrane protein